MPAKRLSLFSLTVPYFVEQELSRGKVEFRGGLGFSAPSYTPAFSGSFCFNRLLPVLRRKRRLPVSSSLQTKDFGWRERLGYCGWIIEWQGGDPLCQWRHQLLLTPRCFLQSLFRTQQHGVTVGNYWDAKGNEHAFMLRGSLAGKTHGGLLRSCTERKLLKSPGLTHLLSSTMRSYNGCVGRALLR